jgi:hypothetical protein
MAVPRVELLYFDGCPNWLAARELVETVGAEMNVAPDLRLVEVESPEAAEELRFLGSPTIRVEGLDVEPGAGDRTPFQYACRVYRTPSGLSGTPDPEWVRQALLWAERRTASGRGRVFRI